MNTNHAEQRKIERMILEAVLSKDSKIDDEAINLIVRYIRQQVELDELFNPKRFGRHFSKNG